MAKNWMLKLDDKIKREEKSNTIHYRNALEITERPAENKLLYVPQQGAPPKW